MTYDKVVNLSTDFKLLKLSAITQNLLHHKYLYLPISTITIHLRTSP
jgi:hypothetical protein